MIPLFPVVPRRAPERDPHKELFYEICEPVISSSSDLFTLRFFSLENNYPSSTTMMLNKDSILEKRVP
jgi:hypothetical protein